MACAVLDVVALYRRVPHTHCWRKTRGLRRVYVSHIDGLRHAATSMYPVSAEASLRTSNLFRLDIPYHPMSRPGPFARWLALGHGLGTLKLYRHPSQPDELQVKFELRGLLDELKASQVEVRACVKDSLKTWAKVFTICGGDPDSAIIPSSRSWTSKHRSQPPEAVLEEYQVEAWAALCIMVQQAAVGKTRDSRSRGLEVLEAFLDEVAQDMDNIFCVFYPLTLNEETSARANECAAASGELAPGPHGCAHMQEILRVALQSEEAYQVVAKVLVGCVACRPACRAAHAHFSAMANKLEAFLTENFHQIGTHDALAIIDVERGSKRRRIDADRKAMLLKRAIDDKNAKSVGTLCKARGERGSHGASDWIHTEIAAYQWCLHASFFHVQNLGIAYDASRLGMPKEETLIVAGYDADRNIAGWFMPQVRGHT